MKKIGIVTFHNAHNYGAMLQAYALQSHLSSENEVEIIDYRNEKIEEQYKLFRKFKKKAIKTNIKTFLSDLQKLNVNRKRRKNFIRFMNEKLNLSERIENVNQLNDVAKNLDILITGSDQVWNPGITGGLSDVYTLNFGNDKNRRISYAASIGNAKLVEENEEVFKNKLDIIDNISVRENDAMLELNKVMKNKNVECVLDPTLLLTAEEWKSKLNNDKKEEKYILAYFVEKDETYRKIVNYLAHKTGLKVIHFEKRNNNYEVDSQSAYTSGPFEFVELIKNAEYVVATSFHATVFSILFNKKFFIVPHKKTGARVTNLLNLLNIDGRIFYDFYEFKKIDIDFETDWIEVNKNLEEQRKRSSQWLKESIER